ncbi:MAG TPA: CBS domain-containing protein [Phenylobacterium sp.]|jgi:CBS domain-containing protein|nr:CBS domain-containing protein [Phenylobacterium sp.]
MPTDNGHFDSPADAALAPFRCYAAFLAWTQEGALAVSQAAAETTANLMTLGSQRTRIRLDWTQAVGRALADLASTALDAQAAEHGGLESGNHTKEVAMRVSDCMTREVQIVDPNDTIAGAAKTMAKLDAGILPVGEDDRLVGMITDRDIAIRAVAAGMGPQAKVGDVMNSEVKYCFEDQEVDEVLRNMGELQVRRLPVLNRDKRLVGIVSLSDMAGNGEARRAADALSHISRPGGLHSQTAH